MLLIYPRGDKPLEPNCKSYRRYDPMTRLSRDYDWGLRKGDHIGALNSLIDFTTDAHTFAVNIYSRLHAHMCAQGPEQVEDLVYVLAGSFSFRCWRYRAHPLRIEGAEIPGSHTIRLSPFTTHRKVHQTVAWPAPLLEPDSRGNSSALLAGRSNIDTLVTSMEYDYRESYWCIYTVSELQALELTGIPDGSMTGFKPPRRACHSLHNLTQTAPCLMAGQGSLGPSNTFHGPVALVTSPRFLSVPFHRRSDTT